MKIRQYIAHRLYDIFPQKFCWADLAVWSLGYHSFFKVFDYYKKPKGCIIESMGKCEGCYCGCWQKGHHYKSFQGNILIEQFKAEEENKEFENNPPF